MNVEMTAEITGQGMTMEALAQAWDTLTDRGVPADAALKISHYASGRWSIKAHWVPAEPAPDEEEADAADRIPLEGTRGQSFGVVQDVRVDDLARVTKQFTDSLGHPPYRM